MHRAFTCRPERSTRRSSSIHKSRIFLRPEVRRWRNHVMRVRSVLSQSQPDPALGKTFASCSRLCILLHRCFIRIYDCRVARRPRVLILLHFRHPPSVRRDAYLSANLRPPKQRGALLKKHESCFSKFESHDNRHCGVRRWINSCATDFDKSSQSYAHNHSQHIALATDRQGGLGTITMTFGFKAWGLVSKRPCWTSANCMSAW